MPSGRTHDAITLITALPAFAATYVLTHSFPAACLTGIAYIFGGLMFGPDLDTISRQYSRWWIFRFLWFPYRTFFRHRSRMSHGLIFGALIRVAYFLGVTSILGLAAVYLYATYRGGRVPDLWAIEGVWAVIGEWIREHFGRGFLLFVFFGLWLGAASHTFTDAAGSFVKTGRVAKFL